jgi:hypothetical protein
VNTVDTKEELFKYYGSMLDKFYSSFKPNTIQNNHIFKFEHTDATLSMQCAIHNEAPFVIQPMLKKGQELVAARRFIQAGDSKGARPSTYKASGAL